jgi:surface antigen
MKRHNPLALSLAAAFVLALASPAALAADNKVFATSPMAKMTDADFTIARAAVDDALDNAPDGEKREWKNPATKASGTIRPGKAFTRDGLRCRSAAFATTAGGKSGQSKWNLCKKDGEWRILGAA